jgi:hypothetical protein
MMMMIGTHTRYHTRYQVVAVFKANQHNINLPKTKQKQKQTISEKIGTCSNPI